MLHLHRIRAVSFDVGGTLIETRPSVGHIYAQIAELHGVQALHPDVLTRQFHLAWKTKGEFDYSQPAWFELVRRTFASRAQELPEEFFPAVFDQFARPDAWQIHPDVLPTLEALANYDIPLAIVSNWDERLRPLLEGLGLRSYFEVVIPSCEVAFHKPSPVIFELLVRKLGLPPEEILHVGDHFTEDVEGAHGAGLQALQLVRNEPKTADYHIASLLELPPIVEAARCGLLTESA
jgi:putative hydrolase of the HAD superfamily